MHPIMGEEVGSGITTMQKQDNTIDQEARDIVKGIYDQIADMVKKQTGSLAALMSHKEAIVKMQDEFKIWKNIE
jgi:hypothetical protein